MPAPGRARRRRRPPCSASSSGRFESCAEQTRSCCRIGFLRGGARPRLPLIVDYIEEHRDAFGVEPICTVLSSADVTIAPSTYYAARTRPPSARAVRDEEVTAELRVDLADPVHAVVLLVHSADLGRDGGVGGRPVARCTVQR